MERKSKDTVKWFAVRVTYGRELKFCSLLEAEGFETFVPMCRKTVEKNGVKEVKTVPAVGNLCFVKSSGAELDAFFKNIGLQCPAKFIWDRATRKPIVIPDKAMEDFMRVSRSMLDDLVYLTEVSPLLKAGKKVRITSGDFAGVEGKIVRIRRSRRVLVELPGMLAVATMYIPPEMLEPM